MLVSAIIPLLVRPAARAQVRLTADTYGGAIDGVIA